MPNGNRQEPNPSEPSFSKQYPTHWIILPLACFPSGPTCLPSCCPVRQLLVEGWMVLMTQWLDHFPRKAGDLGSNHVWMRSCNTGFHTEMGSKTSVFHALTTVLTIGLKGGGTLFFPTIVLGNSMCHVWSLMILFYLGAYVATVEPPEPTQKASVWQV